MVFVYFFVPSSLHIIKNRMQNKGKETRDHVLLFSFCLSLSSCFVCFGICPLIYSNCILWFVNEKKKKKKKRKKNSLSHEKQIFLFRYKRSELIIVSYWRKKQYSYRILYTFNDKHKQFIQRTKQKSLYLILNKTFECRNDAITERENMRRPIMT